MGRAGNAVILTPSWRDHADRRDAAPPVPGPDEPPFYRPIGAFQGEAYRRNAFVHGTREELDALARIVDLGPGTRLLDVGCADARHLRALAHDGVLGVGIDIAPELLEAGRSAARTEEVEVELLVGDARDLAPVLGRRRGSFDVAWSLCHGGLGTSPVTDPHVLAGLAEAVRPGGTVIVTLFHALFAARHLVPGDRFDPVHLVHHQIGEVRDADGGRRGFDLWTAAYTVRDADRLVAQAGLRLVDVRGVAPGAYGRRSGGEVALDDPELLVVARRPS